MSTPIKREDIRKGDVIRVSNEFTAAVDWKPMANDDATYELIERPVTLPTEPGYYLDRQHDVWQLNGSDFVCLESHEVKPETFAPFTPLRPVAEVAAETVAEIATFFESPAWLNDRTWGTVAGTIRTKFGVTK